MKKDHKFDKSKKSKKPKKPKKMVTISQQVGDTRELAFPTAEGFGAYAKGGKGGDRYTVTSTSASGIGTLKDAVDTQVYGVPRTIDFAVGGVIQLTSQLEITKPYLTIDGSTAPSPGISTRDYEVSVENTHDIVIRHIRFRTGDAFPDSIRDGLQLFEVENCIVDHCSFFWAVDENMGNVGGSDLTIQWCILAEGLMAADHPSGDHSMGLIHLNVKSSTIHHNLFTHNNERNPRASGDVDIVNNIVYNYGNIGTDISNDNVTGTPDTRANVENNYWIEGPSSPNPAFVRYFRVREGASAWVSGNYIDNNDNGVLDGVLATTYAGDGDATITTRYNFPQVETETALEAYTSVLAGAGATLPSRDAHDARVVADVSAETGAIIDSQTEVGGW